MRAVGECHLHQHVDAQRRQPLDGDPLADQRPALGPVGGPLDPCPGDLASHRRTEPDQALGEHRLKGVEDPASAFRVVGARPW